MCSRCSPAATLKCIFCCRRTGLLLKPGATNYINGCDFLANIDKRDILVRNALSPGSEVFPEGLTHAVKSMSYVGFEELPGLPKHPAHSPKETRLHCQVKVVVEEKYCQALLDLNTLSRCKAFALLIFASVSTTFGCVALVPSAWIVSRLSRTPFTAAFAKFCRQINAISWPPSRR